MSCVKERNYQTICFGQLAWKCREEKGWLGNDDDDREGWTERKKKKKNDENENQMEKRRRKRRVNVATWRSKTEVQMENKKK